MVTRHVGNRRNAPDSGAPICGGRRTEPGVAFEVFRGGHFAIARAAGCSRPGAAPRPMGPPGIVADARSARRAAGRRRRPARAVLDRHRRTAAALRMARPDRARAGAERHAAGRGRGPPVTRKKLRATRKHQAIPLRAPGRAGVGTGVRSRPELEPPLGMADQAAKPTECIRTGRRNSPPPRPINLGGLPYAANGRRIIGREPANGESRNKGRGRKAGSYSTLPLALSGRSQEENSHRTG